MSALNLPPTRHEIIQLLDKFGRANKLFYAWLIQNNLLESNWKDVAFGILATEFWQLTGQVTGSTPDEMNFLALQKINLTAATSRRFTPRSLSVAPPSVDSPWREFYLPPDAYLDVTALLDSLLNSQLLAEADAQKFAKEYTF